MRGSRKNNEPIIKNRTAEQKAVNQERQKALDKAKTRARQEEAQLRNELNAARKAAGNGTKGLSRKQKKLLQDNGLWGEACKIDRKNKGVERW
jgi:hypothetical protein